VVRFSRWIAAYRRARTNRRGLPDALLSQGDPLESMLPIRDPEVIARTAEAIWREKNRREESKPETVLKFQTDPLGFVKWGWRWGLPGPLERFQGPDTWQEDFLIELGELMRSRNFDGRNPVKPIKMTRSAGKGVGKSALVGMVNTFLMQTWPYCQGTATANTFAQLESKTWAGIQHWFKTSRMTRDFNITGGGIQHRVHKKSWQCTPQTCREENAEAFAGQHAANSIQYYLFDESSGIPEKIWETAESGMVDGMPIFLAFGNSTRANGRFFRINFGDLKDRWSGDVVDARDCLIPNQETLAEDIKFYGEDSDYVRVYIKGLAPQHSDLQYISTELIYAAQKRMPQVLADEPIVAGVDLARGGTANAVVWFRKGDDARTIPPIIIPGHQIKDSMLLVSKLADLAGQKINGQEVAMWFVDGGNMGGPIIDRMKQLGHENFTEVQFGAACPDPDHFANMRVWMWSKMREWLQGRGCIPLDAQLETDLGGPGVHHMGNSDRWVLESKKSMEKRGLASPDRADALALCFAATVKPKTDGSDWNRKRDAWGRGGAHGEHSWMMR
jgi:hypothetical protein